MAPAPLQALTPIHPLTVHNAAGGTFGNFLAIAPAALNANFQVNVMALLHLARWAAPQMQAAGSGAIIVTGNTASQRGRANFAGFAPTKAAQRILAEAMARDLGPQGIHGAHQPRSAWSFLTELRPFNERW